MIVHDGVEHPEDVFTIAECPVCLPRLIELFKTLKVATDPLVETLLQMPPETKDAVKKFFREVVE